MEERYQVYVALVELLLRLGKPDDAFSIQRSCGLELILIS
jgi:hypothetical protein